MTVSIAATACTCPQYGHFSEVVPGAYSSRAPHWVQWNVRVPGVVTGGAGAAVRASSGATGWSVMASRSRVRGFGGTSVGQDGGSGGGTAASTDASSATSPAGDHAGMPFLQTSVDPVRDPARAWAARPSASNGPCCRPSTPTNHCDCVGSGGGPDGPGACGAC